MFGKHTNLIVGGVLGAGMLVVLYNLVSVPWFVGLSLLFIYEAWTLINRFPQDTISETIWRFSKQPILPHLFGLFNMWLLMSGTITPTKPGLIVVYCYGVLSGHFFFSRECTEKECDEREASEK